jgi:DNA segregation ATPase FtsK/SpoIIIE-like protein
LKALKRAVDIMNIRYNKLKECKVRNIYEYNEKVDEKNKMSRIVIIVDELADLMMS